LKAEQVLGNILPHVAIKGYQHYNSLGVSQFGIRISSIQMIRVREIYFALKKYINDLSTTIEKVN
jgi:hypothetical protein